MRIGVFGTRGVPASYSGFETCAEELGARLAARGHEVTVYCRVPHITYAGGEYRGMRLVKLPDHPHQAPRHDGARAAVRPARARPALRRGPVLQRGRERGVLDPAPRRPAGRPQRRRARLEAAQVGRASRARYIRGSERWATRLPAPHRHRLAPGAGVLPRRATAPTPSYIAYGAEPVDGGAGRAPRSASGCARAGTCSSWAGWCPRIAPTTWSTPGAGSARTSGARSSAMPPTRRPTSAPSARAADPRVVFTGLPLRRGLPRAPVNAYCFVETSEVGGTHPALLEAMARGRPP